MSNKCPKCAALLFRSLDNGDWVEWDCDSTQVAGEFKQSNKCHIAELAQRLAAAERENKGLRELLVAHARKTRDAVRHQAFACVEDAQDEEKKDEAEGGYGVCVNIAS